MAGEKAPYFKLYAFDWDSDFTQRVLDCAGAGILMRLMVGQWIEGALPDDPEKLRLYVRATPEEWARAWPLLEEKFPLSLDGERRSERLEHERREMERVSEQQRQRGSAKWKAVGHKTEERKTRSQRLAEARARGRHTKEEWERLCAVFDNKCVRCGEEAGLTRDHVLPIYLGGSDAIENVQPICMFCNGQKGSESIDYRPTRVLDWRERMRDACRTPAERLPDSANQEPNPDPDSSSASSPRGRALWWNSETQGFDADPDYPVHLEELFPLRREVLAAAYEKFAHWLRTPKRDPEKEARRQELIASDDLSEWLENRLREDYAQELARPRNADEQLEDLASDRRRGVRRRARR